MPPSFTPLRYATGITVGVHPLLGTILKPEHNSSDFSFLMPKQSRTPGAQSQIGRVRPHAKLCFASVWLTLSWAPFPRSYRKQDHLALSYALCFHQRTNPAGVRLSALRAA